MFTLGKYGTIFAWFSENRFANKYADSSACSNSLTNGIAVLNCVQRCSRKAARRVKQSCLGVSRSRNVLMKIALPRDRVSLQMNGSVSGAGRRTADEWSLSWDLVFAHVAPTSQFFLFLFVRVAQYVLCVKPRRQTCAGDVAQSRARSAPTVCCVEVKYS